jgi:hypothetical protein
VESRYLGLTSAHNASYCKSSTHIGCRPHIPCGWPWFVLPHFVLVTYERPNRKIRHPTTLATTVLELFLSSINTTLPPNFVRIVGSRFINPCPCLSVPHLYTSAKISAARSKSRLRSVARTLTTIRPHIFGPSSSRPYQPHPGSTVRTLKQQDILPHLNSSPLPTILLPIPVCFQVLIVIVLHHLSSSYEFNVYPGGASFPSLLCYSSANFTCQLQIYWAPFRSYSSCKRHYLYLKLYFRSVI